MKHPWVKILFLAALLALTLAAPAHAADERGTEFWLAFPINHTGADTLELYITSDVNASGTVSIPGQGWSTNFSVTANVITTVYIFSAYEISESWWDEISDYGIHVTADEQVVVYGLSYKTQGLGSSADGYLGLPVDALGTNYLVLAYPLDDIVDFPGSMFTIVATEDDTTVDIIPTADTYNYSAGVPYQLTMNAGQTFMSLVDHDYGNGDDLTGTEISADKPIAVFGGNRTANVPLGYASADFLIEQLPPVSAWGTEFAVMSLETYTNYPGTYRFLASEDDTQITINGVDLAFTLGRGAVYEDETLTAPLHITSDKPILAAQYANSQQYESGSCVWPTACDFDPSMLLLPPVDQWRSTYVINTSSSVPFDHFAADYINVVAPAAMVGSVLLDGTAIPAGSFTAIDSGTYYGAQVAVSDGAHTLSAPLPFAVHVYGFADEGSYGYPGGSGTDDDYGDLPDVYGTLLASDGARHTVISGATYLGSVVPGYDADGQPNASANGDDTDGSADEDGVTVNGLWSDGAVGGAVNVTISGAPACLGAFFDFAEGSGFNSVTLRDSGGTAVSQPLAVGMHTLYFDVPSGTFPGSGPDFTIYARFRAVNALSGSCSGSLAYNATGLAPNGEVEDYGWGFHPTAVTLQQLTANANDVGALPVLALAALLAFSAVGVAVVSRKRRLAK